MAVSAIEMLVWNAKPRVGFQMCSREKSEIYF